MDEKFTGYDFDGFRAGNQMHSLNQPIVYESKMATIKVACERPKGPKGVSPAQRSVVKQQRDGRAG
jgi:hypothetical protein